MEKSIDERANKFALEKHPYSPFCEEYTKMYIEIATEQKAIDIEKAQKSVCQDICTCTTKCKEPNMNCEMIYFITKAMEE